jgi:hypothetical protein
MKNVTRLFAVMIIAIITSSMTSCLKDNDNETTPITQEEAMRYMYQIGGEYSGKLFFYNDTITTSSTKIDSVAATVSITANDSTIMLKGIPGRAFSKLLPSTQYESLRKALDNVPPIDLTIRYVFYSATEDQFVYYGVYPMSKTIKLNYDGADHSITFNFYSLINANGQYFKNQTYFPLYLTEVRLDNMLERSFTVSGYYTDNNCIYNFRGAK